MPNYKPIPPYGNVVNGIGSTGAGLTFQPASGIECVITWLSDVTNGHQLYNGTLGTTTIIFLGNNYFESLYINNTNYLNIGLTAAKVKGYSGFEI